MFVVRRTVERMNDETIDEEGGESALTSTIDMECTECSCR
jgi:hypothetical protein